MTDSKFYTKTRQLTAYALACGYADVERNLVSETRLTWNGTTYDVQTTLKGYSGKYWEWSQHDNIASARRAMRLQQRRAYEQETELAIAS